MGKVIYLALLCLIASTLFAQPFFTENFERADVTDIWTINSPTRDDGVAFVGDDVYAVSFPIAMNWGYTVSEQIYLASELAAAGFTTGSITNIGFTADRPIDMSGYHNDWMIYLGETTQETFDIWEWIPLTSMLLVFDGKVPTEPLVAGDLLNIPLNENYIYRGGNLVVCVLEYTDSASYTGMYSSFRGSSTWPDCRSLRSQNDEDAYVPKGPTAWGAGFEDDERAKLYIKYTVPSAGLDLAVTAFTAPALLPSTDNIYITIANNGGVGVTATQYTVKVYQEGNAEALHTFPASENQALGAVAEGVFDSCTYYIHTSTYNSWWTSNVAGGVVTLRAEVEIENDTSTTNNTRTVQTILLPQLDLAVYDFYTPGRIPSDDNMTVTVQNKGALPVTSGGYTVKILQAVGQTTTELYSFPADQIVSLSAAVSGTYASHTYTITPATYMEWFPPTVPGDEFITLIAEVTIASDANPNNDSRTRQSYLRATRDIEVAFTTGPTLYPSLLPLKVTLCNYGWTEIAAGSYTVDFSINNTTFHTISGADALAIDLDNEVVFEVPASLIHPALTNVTGGFYIKITAISIPTETFIGNNTGQHYASIFSIAPDIDAIVEVGIYEDWIPTNGSSGVLPFSMYNYYTYSQSIYTAENMAGIAEGLITHLYYMFSRGEGNINQPVNIYMANSAKTSFSSTTDWVPNSDFILVKSGLDLSGYDEWNSHDVWIALDTPFLYTGQSLVIMNHRPTPNTSFNSSAGFYQSSPIPNSQISMYKVMNGAGFEFGSVGTATGIVDYKPQTRFALAFGEFGIISGNITGQGSNSVSGVTISQGVFSTTSDADGHFNVFVNKTSTIPLTFTKIGYASQTLNVATITGWVTHADDFDTYTHNVTMVPVDPVTVTGTVRYIDNSNPVGGVTVSIAGLSGISNTTTGVYSISGALYPYATYPVTIDMSAHPGYVDYEDTVYIDPALVANNSFTHNIYVAEDRKRPKLVTAFINANNTPEVNWYSPYTRLTDVTLTRPGYVNSAYTNTDLKYIAANRYSSAMLDTLGTHGVRGAELIKVSFFPASGEGTFTIHIWTGSDLANPNVTSPTYSQVITQTLLAMDQNSVELDTPFVIPTTGELVIGIECPQGNGLYVYGSSADRIEGYGNKMYDFGTCTWTTLYAVNNYWYEHWQIYAAAVAEGSAPASAGMRAFGDKYNVYRLYDFATFENATLLTPEPITGGTTLKKSFQDSGFFPTPGYYNYAVTSVYEGNGYTTYGESEPGYTYYFDIGYIVSGELTSAVNDVLTGLKVKLVNQDTAGYSPAEVTVNSSYQFEFQVLPGVYQLIVSKGTNEYAHPTLISVTNDDQTGITVTVPQSLDNVDLSVVPVVTALSGNYPNPFNPTTTIAFDLAKDGLVTIDVYNIKGQRVRSLTNGVYRAGKYTVAGMAMMLLGVVSVVGYISIA